MQRLLLRSSPLFLALVFACPLASADPAPPVPVAPKAVALPATPAGATAEAYFAAFNSGNDEALRAFELSRRAKSSLAKRPMEDRLTQMHELRDRWGELRPDRVLSSGENALKLLVHAATPDYFFAFAFEFEEAAPHGLLSIGIEGPIDPNEAQEAALPLSVDSRAKAVNDIADALVEAYVFPDKGEEMAIAIRKKLADGAYASLDDADAFARRLTDDLQSVSHDKHLRVRPGAAHGPTPGPARAMPPGGPKDNYTFEKTELLPGNIGYIKFNGFLEGDDADKAAAAALATVAGCDALIFDLRDNGGGSPSMIKFISSYLFDVPTHLNSFYDRTANKTSETWTTAEVPGKRFAATLPVYILTSGRTFSAAEEFTYNLKNLKRATIVGETTGGGAHPVQPRSAGDRFTVMVPYARAVNPITKTNWEGVGIKPDIECPAGKALDTACEDARARIAAAHSTRP